LWLRSIPWTQEIASRRVTRGFWRRWEEMENMVAIVEMVEGEEEKT